MVWGLAAHSASPADARRRNDTGAALSSPYDSWEAEELRLAHSLCPPCEAHGNYPKEEEGGHGGQHCCLEARWLRHAGVYV